MRYIVPRDRGGSLSTTQVLRHDDDGSLYFFTVDDDSREAVAYRDWLAAGNAADPEPAPPFDADAVLAECRRRIFERASQTCQMNMTAYVASGGASADELAAFRSALGWVAAMRAACADMIAAQDATFADDARWPACPAEALALAARF